MSEQEIKLSDKERHLLTIYSDEARATKERLSLLQLFLRNLMNIALYARGLSLDTHLIDENGVIREIKQEAKNGKTE